MKKGKKVVILGLGNILFKDEGIGVHIVKELEKKALADDIELIDGGTASLGVLTSLRNIDKVVIIDALKLGKEPGTVYRIDKQNIESRLETVNLSLHQISLLEALAIAKKLNTLPKEIVLIGVEPSQIDWGLEVTDTIKERIPKIIKLVSKEMAH